MDDGMGLTSAMDLEASEAGKAGAAAGEAAAASPASGGSTDVGAAAGPTYTRGHRLVEIASIVVVFGLLAAFAVQLLRTIETPAGWGKLGLTALCAYVATDMISGDVHWAADTVGHEDVPFLGLNFIRPFREHHTDQKAITHHDFVETNGNNCIVVFLPLALAFLALPS